MRKFLIVIAFFCAVGTSARAEPEGVYPSSEVSRTVRIEVPLQALRAPTTGFDDTNNVEVVMYGVLGACYQLSHYSVEKDPLGHSITVRQWATKTENGPCAFLDELPEQMKMVAPFTTVVPLRQLAAGTYQLNYHGANGEVHTRSLNVAKAKKTSIDDYPYAAVSSVSTSDVIQKKDRLSVTLSGVYTSGCAYLDDASIKIEKFDDVFVILPVLKRKSGMCIDVLIPFVKEVDLGIVEKRGDYLVHVRSMNGRSVNKMVKVVD